MKPNNDAVLFECANCHKTVIYPKWNSDGHNCKECGGGPLIPIKDTKLEKQITPDSPKAIEIKLERKKYDLFLCVKCKNITAFKEDCGKGYFGEGNNCPVCHNPLIMKIGTYKFDKF